MGFKLKTVLHVTGILVTVFLLVYCLLNTNYYATMLTLSLLLMFQVHGLLHFISSTNRQLTRFLDAVKHADFAMSFKQPGLDSGFESLGRSLDDVIQRFREQRSEKESQAAFLHTFVEQVPIAVLALQDDDSIEICNKALRQLCGKQELKHLHQISDFDRQLANTIRALRPGVEESLKLRLGNDVAHFKLSCSVLRTRGKALKLVSIQDIQGELEAAELNAWQNLIRVMTHEIMNSITPITSLAETSGQYLKEAESHLAPAQSLDRDAVHTLLQDAESAIDTIGNRSKGLMRFVESYRTLTRLPKPTFEPFRINDLLRSVSELMADQAEKQDTLLNMHCRPENLELNADQAMLEQALINLVKNALDAVAGLESPAISVSANLLEKGRINLVVQDNGSGIDEENLDNIFIPFFTTKRGGSGIGMSIVKQIVRLNGGQISVTSKIGQGTTMTMTFG